MPTHFSEHIYRKDWPVEGAKAAVVLVHGQAEHCGRHEYAARALNARGYSVYAGDLPGHGRSGGLRGHIDRFDDYVDTVADWIEDARRREPGLPTFLLGHSVGGLIAARYVETRSEAANLAGVVLTSPAFRVRYPIPAWKTALSLKLDGLLPRLRMPTGLHKQRVTRNEEVVRATAADPLVVAVASIRFYNELLRAQAAALRDAERVRLPLLLLHGGADEIIDPTVSLEFGRATASADRDVRLVPGLHHEIMNEPERDDVLRDIADWLDARATVG